VQAEPMIFSFLSRNNCKKRTVSVRKTPDSFGGYTIGYYAVQIACPTLYGRLQFNVRPIRGRGLLENFFLPTCEPCGFMTPPGVKRW